MSLPLVAESIFNPNPSPECDRAAGAREFVFHMLHEFQDAQVSYGSKTARSLATQRGPSSPCHSLRVGNNAQIEVVHIWFVVRCHIRFVIDQVLGALLAGEIQNWWASSTRL